MDRKRPQIRLITTLLPQGIEAISGDAIVHTFRPHIHSTYLIGGIYSGERRFTHPGGETRIAAGESFVLNPGQVHACETHTDVGHSYKILSVTVDAMLSFMGTPGEKPAEPPRFPAIPLNDPNVCHDLTGLFDALAPDGDRMEVHSRVHALLCRVLDHAAPSGFENVFPKKIHAAIRRIQRHMELNPELNGSLDQLAAMAGLSPWHFHKEFKHTVGVTPHEHLCAVKIRHARTLLLETRNLADTALRLGFADQSHFTRVFKKIMGVPPGNFLKAHPKTDER